MPLAAGVESALMGNWHLYIVRTYRGALYTGISTDVARRLQEHSMNGGRGAKYLRAQTPLQLAYQIKLGDRSLALRAERRIKRLPKRHKERLVSVNPARVQLLTMLGLTIAHERRDRS